MRSLSSLVADREPLGSRGTNPRYARVFFALRRSFGLTVSECLLVDTVAILSRKSGWCFASRSYLANLFGVSTRTLRRMVASLKERGLVEGHPTDPRLLRPTRAWRDVSYQASGTRASR